MRNLLALALSLSVSITEDDVLELGYDVTDEDFKTYFEIPEDAETQAGYKKHDDFNPETLKPFMNTEEIAQAFASDAAPADSKEEKPKKETAAQKKKREKAEAEAEAAKEASGESSEKEAAPAKEKKPGVIASILSSIQNSKTPISEAGILESLKTLFPERDVVSMGKTIKAQLGGKNQPLRMEEEKGVKFVITYTEAKEGEKPARLYAIAK